MKNLMELLDILVNRKIITQVQTEKIIDTVKNEYPNTDLLKIEIREEKRTSILDDVFTFGEAAELCNINRATLLRKNERKQLDENEIRKSGGTWLITKKEIERLYGYEPLHEKINKNKKR